jgi:ribosome-interacting GTPase 1
MPCLCKLPAFSSVLIPESILQDVYNKIDAISLEQVNKIAREPNSVVISCEMDLK